MPEPRLSRGSFLDELKRRKVVRVAIVYAAVAWVTVQIADVALPAFEAPDWVLRVLIALLVLGFPVVVALAWALDVTPEGLRVTPAAGREGAESTPGAGDGRTSWMSTRSALAAVLLVAAGGAVGWFASERPGGAERDGPGRAIAVLPFANLAGEDEQYFVDGIHDDILTQLSQLENLTVISRTSMLRYRDTEKGIPEIAAELGVGSVLEGSVQKRGDRVRITAQLIDAGSDAHLWADSFDETLGDYFAIQSRIATEIASALHATLTPAEEERMAEAATENTAALDRYLRGIVYLGRWWGEGDAELPLEEVLGRAAENLEAAVELDPGYATAWARLAEAYTELYWLGGGEDWRRRAREAVRRAEVLDAELPETAYSKALYAYHGEQRYEDALALLGRAQRLAPNDARVYRAQGWVLRRLGRFQEALDAFDASLRLDPLGSEGWKVLDSYLHARRYEQVLDVVRRLAGEDPGASALARDLYEVSVAARRDGELGEASRLLSHGAAIARSGLIGDPIVNPVRFWVVGLDVEELAALATTFEEVLPTLDAFPQTQVYVHAFRAWVLHDVLRDEAAPGAAEALEHATANALQDTSTDQVTAELLGRRAVNHIRLGDPDRAVALADSLVIAFPLERDAWWAGPLALRVQAAVYARVGRDDEAIDIVMGLVEPPSWYTPGSLPLEPAFEPLHDHPRWPEVVEAAR